MKPELLLVGKTSAAHGLYGKIRLVVFAESMELFKKGRKIYLCRNGQELTFTIISAAQYKRRFAIFTLAGVDDRNQAEAIEGFDVFIDKAYLPAIEADGVFYWKDLIGISVYEEDGSLLGVLESIMETGSNDVYVIKSADRETLVPALASVVKMVDIPKKMMVVDLPEGL